MEATNSTRTTLTNVHNYKKKENNLQNDSDIKESLSEIKIELTEEPHKITSESEKPTNCSSGGSLSESQCRICFGGKDIAPLISACRCTGSIAYAHEQCLLRWLEEKGTDQCEICCTTYRQTRNLRSIRQWTCPSTLFRPNIYRGLFLTTIIWLCMYYFIIIAIQPHNFLMKEVFFCVMYSLLMVLIITTVVVFKNSCQSFTTSVRQWIALNSQASFTQP